MEKKLEPHDKIGENMDYKTLTDGEEIRSNKEYYCEKCDYFTKKYSDYVKHTNTKKHKNIHFNHTLSKTQCIYCNKNYSSASNLWKHKAKCFQNPDVTNPIESIEQLVESKPEVLSNDVILELIKQNKELQSVLVEQSAAIIEQSTKLAELTNQPRLVQNTTNNTTNNQFNLNLFLNEHCKDAVNIIDFVNSLHVQIKDLEKTGKLGYVEGITSIFLKGLSELDVCSRPIHCTDLKRETVYVKDQDMWEKDNAEKAKLKMVVKQIARKNLRALPEWQQKNPEFEFIDTKENEEFLQISLNSLGGQTKEEEEQFNDKIIRNVLRSVVVDKKSENMRLEMPIEKD
jgi:hypothetical protein